MWLIILYQIVVYYIWASLAKDLDSWFLYIFMIFVNIYIWRKFNIEKISEIKKNYVLLSSIVFLVVWLFRSIDIMMSFF